MKAIARFRLHFLLLGFAFHCAGAQDNSRPPFPEVWDPNPLRFHYAESDSLFATMAYLPPPAIAKHPITRTFPLPAVAHRGVRVLLQSQAASLSLSAQGNLRMQLRQSDGSTSDGPVFSGTVRVARSHGEFRITAGNGRAFSTGPATGLRFIAADPAAPLEWNGKPYRGNIEVYPDGDNLQCVNSVGLEDYVRGVVALEMGRPPASGLEALKAQAVVARTFAVKRMTETHAANFDLHASVQDQVYGGAEAETPLGDQAVHQTEGWVLLHADTLALCYYHSTCGGMTASRNEVWGGPVIPYLVSQPDRDSLGRPWCRASKYMQWTQSWDADKLAAILRANLGAAGARDVPAFRRLTGFRILDRFADGRIRALEVDTDRGPFILHGDKVRFALKPGTGAGRILESARFDIELSGNRVTANGSGFGHGIGLCQMGALGRAQAGQPCAEILAAYYPGTALAKLR